MLLGEGLKRFVWLAASRQNVNCLSSAQNLQYELRL